MHGLAKRHEKCSLILSKLAHVRVRAAIAVTRASVTTVVVVVVPVLAVGTTGVTLQGALVAASTASNYGTANAPFVLDGVENLN